MESQKQKKQLIENENNEMKKELQLLRIELEKMKEISMSNVNLPSNEERNKQPTSTISLLETVLENK